MVSFNDTVNPAHWVLTRGTFQRPLVGDVTPQTALFATMATFAAIKAVSIITRRTHNKQCKSTTTF